MAQQSRQQRLVDPVGVVRRTPARRGLVSLAGRAPLLVGRAPLLVGRAESRPRRLLAQLDLELPAHLAELGLEVLPLADPEVVEVLPLAHPAEGAGREVALLGPQVSPEVEPGQEVGGRVLETGVQLVGLGLLLQRPLARVLQGQGGGDDEDVADAAEPLRLEDHPAQAWVDGQARQTSTDRGEIAPAPPAGRACRDQRAELLEQLHAGGDVAAVGRLDEREAGDVAEPERGHLQDDRGQVGAQDLRIGERRPGLEVLLRVEPDRHARLDPAAAARPLLGRGLADRLDREPLHLGLERVARDPRQPGVHDVPDAGHGERGLGDVRGEHDAADRRRVGGEHAVLLGSREPGVERHDLEGAAALDPSEVGEGVGGVADLALAGQEDEDVSRPLHRELTYGVDDRLGLVADELLALRVDLLAGRAGRHHERVGSGSPPGRSARRPR